MKFFSLKAAVAACLLVATAAHAGPFILAGTDADDHGSANGVANLNGWLFMQRALENLAPGVTNGNKVVTILGSTGSASTASNSAFNFSNLSGAGWTIQTVSTANFGTFFGAGGGINNAGILMMDSGGNVSGGVDGNAFVPFASLIDNFLGAGGGLFSQANGYQWLTTLLPTIGIVGGGATGLALTTEGGNAFPGLSNPDLSSGPWHNYFTNTGALPVLARSTTVSVGGEGVAVIIGGAAGSITNPGGSVPEPTSLALVGAALMGAFWSQRRRKSASAQ